MAMSLGSFASRVVATRVVALDGTGDFTNIQSAIDDLPTGGGSVYVKEGTYNITSSISLNKDNVALIGSGRNTIINSTSGEYWMISATSQTGLLVDHLRLTLSSGTASAITFVSCSNSMINRVWTDALVESIYFNDCTSSIVSGCIITDTTNNGIAVWGPLTPDVGNNVVLSNVINNAGVAGIVLNRQDYNSATNNNIVNCGGDGITLAQSDFCVVSQNICSLNGDVGAVTFRNGIRVDTDANTNIVSNNVSENNGHYGILIEDSTCDKNLVHGNICLNNTSGNLQDNGTGTVLADNITA